MGRTMLRVIKENGLDLSHLLEFFPGVPPSVDLVEFTQRFEILLIILMRLVSSGNQEVFS